MASVTAALAIKLTRALSRVAAYTVKAGEGPPEREAVIGQPVSANSCVQPNRSARSSYRSLPTAKSQKFQHRNSTPIFLYFSAARHPIRIRKRPRCYPWGGGSKARAGGASSSLDVDVSTSSAPIAVCVAPFAPGRERSLRPPCR
jgi:hypothetical protein